MMDRDRSLGLKRTRAVCLSLALVSEGVFAMGPMYLFSAVDGVVTRRGKPLPGCRVERSFFWHWKDERGSESAVTDAGGRFAFAEIARTSLLGSLLPHEPMVEQTILIHHDGRSCRAWTFDKRNYDKNGELQGRSISLRCDLDAALARDSEVCLCAQSAL